MAWLSVSREGAVTEPGPSSDTPPSGQVPFRGGGTHVAVGRRPLRLAMWMSPSERLECPPMWSCGHCPRR